MKECRIYVGQYNPLDGENKRTKSVLPPTETNNAVCVYVFKNYKIEKRYKFKGYLTISENQTTFNNDPKTFTTSNMNLDVCINGEKTVIYAIAQNYLLRQTENVNEPVILRYPIASQNSNTKYKYIKTEILGAYSPRNVFLIK